MSFFYRTMGVLVAQPLLAAVPAAIFFALYAASRTSLALIAAAAWLLYVPYEYGMTFRILCSGECNIRVDLLLIYPALVILSVIALVASVRVFRVPRRMQ
jgi:hypothetical protein